MCVYFQFEIDITAGVRYIDGVDKRFSNHGPWATYGPAALRKWPTRPDKCIDVEINE